MSFLKNNRGSVLDLFGWMLMLFIIGLFMLLAFYLKDQLLSPLKSMLSATAGNPDVDSPRSIVTASETGFSILDNAFLVVTGGIALGAVIMAFVVKAHPALLIISIVLLAIVLVVLPVISNTFRNLATSSQFSSYVDTSLPYTKTIFINFPLFGLVFGFIILVVMYGKIRGGGKE